MRLFTIVAAIGVLAAGSACLAEPDNEAAGEQPNNAASAPQVHPERLRRVRQQNASPFQRTVFMGGLKDEPLLVDMNNDGVEELAIIGTEFGAITGERTAIFVYSANGELHSRVSLEKVRTGQSASAIAMRVGDEFRWVVARVEEDRGPRVSMHSADGKRLWEVGPEMPGLMGRAVLCAGPIRANGETGIVAASDFFSYSRGRGREDEEAHVPLPTPVVMVVGLDGTMLSCRQAETSADWIRILGSGKEGAPPSIILSAHGRPLALRFTEGSAPEENPAAPAERPKKNDEPAKTPY